MIDGKRRRVLLERLAAAAKQDGLVDQRGCNILFCEVLTELLRDSVYSGVGVDPVESVDVTAASEVG